MLRRQLLRSLWRGRRSYFACILLMAIGTAIYIAFHLLYTSLSAAMDSMYRQQRFGEVFAQVSLMPLSAVDKVEAIDGVAQVDATLVADARVLVEDDARIVTLRLSSFDPGDARRLNDVVMVQGSIPDAEGILVGEVFAEANGLSLGDEIVLVVEGIKFSPQITGIVQSPEYVYAIPDTGQLMPDNRSWGFGYMPAERLGVVTGKTGFATNLSMVLEEGNSFDGVKYQLEDALAPYGIRSLISREDQPSHVMLEQEVQSIGTMATSFPMLFIAIAVAILYIMLKRMIEQERTQIGILKAFGFSDAAILLHYMGYGMVTGVVGGSVGMAMGLGLTAAITPVYLEFFRLPTAHVPLQTAYLLYGGGIALGAGVLGSVMGARSILRLAPGDAMRPPAPPAVRGDLVGRLPFLGVLLNSFGYMALRNMTRNKMRSLFVLLGVAVSFAITAFMASYNDMFDALMLNQFNKVEQYNLKISLVVPAPHTGALEAAWAMAGVRRAEGVLELPVELRSGHLKKSAPIVGIQEDSRLYHIYDNEKKTTFQPHYGGLVLSSALADDLQVGRGDILDMVTPYTGEDPVRIPVMQVVESNLGGTAYIRMDGLWDLLEIAPTVTGVILDADDPDALKSLLLEADNISAITDQEAAKRIYTDMLNTYGVMFYMLQLAGMGIAFAIIANTATISLSERKREYATMRVLGMHPGEIGKVVGLEYWSLTLLAVPPGILFTRLFKLGMAGMIDNEIFSMPLRTEPSSYLAAGALCGLAVLLSNLSARRKIAGFDMVEVLKERE